MCEAAGRVSGPDHRRTSVPRVPVRAPVEARSLPAAAMVTEGDDGGAGAAEVASGVSGALDKALGSAAGRIGAERREHVAAPHRSADVGPAPAALPEARPAQPGAPRTTVKETLASGGAGATKEAALKAVTPPVITAKAATEGTNSRILEYLGRAKTADKLIPNNKRREYEERVMAQLAEILGVTVDLSSRSKRERTAARLAGLIRQSCGDEVMDKMPQFLEEAR